MIGLALSGGGSRAIAFHLGCLRALHDRGILERVNVMSAVSGGAIIAAMYGYSKDDFEAFDKRVTSLLRRGLHWSVTRSLLSPTLLLRILATNIIANPSASIARLMGTQPPLRRWASRTDALEDAIRRVIGSIELSEVRRPNLDVVFNACELRTGTAFRFSNKFSGSWRYGQVEGNRIEVAHAVACSAAYPLLLPAFDRQYTFIRNRIQRLDRVMISDGGVYDNLGIACLEPGRDQRFSLHHYSVDYLISCNAGQGQFTGNKIPYGSYSRMSAAFDSVFRKVQDAAFDRLHTYQRAGMLKGFVLSYLGQQDATLLIKPADLVGRDEVVGYPTNFAAMSEDHLTKLSKRGEQLTRALLNTYCADL